MDNLRRRKGKQNKKNQTEVNLVSTIIFLFFEVWANKIILK